MAKGSVARSVVMVALGVATGAAATLAVLAARMRVYHHGMCPGCGAPLVVSYEPSDEEPRIRLEEAAEHDPPVGEIIRRAREHPRRPSRTVIIIR